jgi:hypothetical protein
MFFENHVLQGPAAAEVMMTAGLKGAFNQALLRGEFPLWNAFIETGNVFLLFGATPLSVFTPIELFSGPHLGDRAVAFSLAAFYFITALFMMMACRYLKIPLWAGLLGTILYLIIEPIALLSHFPFVHDQIIATMPFLVLTTLLYFVKPGRMLLISYWVLCLILTLGGKPEIIAMFFIYGGLLVTVLSLHSILMNKGGGIGQAALFAVKNVVLFVLVPLLFYAWQLPLVRALLRVSTGRFTGSSETLSGALQNITLSFYFSTTIKIFVVIACFLIIAWLLLLLEKSLQTGQAQSPMIVIVLRYSNPVLASFITYIFIHLTGWGDILNRPSICLFSAVLLVVFWNMIKIPDFSESASCEAQFSSFLSSRGIWRLPFISAALYSAMSETMLLKTGFAPDRLAVSLHPQPFSFFPETVLTFVILIGALSSIKGNREVSREGELLQGFQLYLLIALILGWILREFLTLPLYDFLDFVYANPRDIFFYGAIPSWFFILGALEIRNQHILLESRFPKGGSKIRRAFIFVPILACMLMAACLCYSCIYAFHAPRGQYTENVTWYHANRDELEKLQILKREYIESYKAARSGGGGFVRGITTENSCIGNTGHGADRGVPEAWGYAFCSDSWLNIARGAFFLKPADFPFPRPYAYSISVRRVYDARYPSLKSLSLWELYGNYAYPKLSGAASIDSFLIELLRVGIIWRLNDGTKFKETGDLKLVREIPPMAIYRFYSRRSLRQYGVLPLVKGESALSFASGSQHRQELESCYGQMLFSEDELKRGGFRISGTDLRSNRQRFIIEADRPGILIVFDGWHPDWKAFRNGSPTELHRVFLNFRGLHLESGENRIDLVFEPQYLKIGAAISIISIILLTCFSFRSLISSRSRKEKSLRQEEG